MSEPISIEAWEELVKKQQNLENLYESLSKENLEGLVVKPIYAKEKKERAVLPRLEESSSLVAPYHESLEQDVYSFALENNVEDLEDKTLFVTSKELCEHIVTDLNRVFPLVEPFEESTQKLSDQLVKEFLAKGFERALCIDLTLYQNAGATMVQQLAVGLGKLKELVEVFGPECLEEVLFRISVGSNYFFEIAKIRALKLLFNQFCQEYDKTGVPYIFAQTSNRNKSKLDIENNLIRSTLELSSAMVGGADALYSSDYKLESGSEWSREIGFKQQIVLAYESLINVFEDALGGSYYVEDLTLQLCEKAWAEFLEIEKEGGFEKAFENGSITQKIYQSACKEQSWVQEGRIKLIGVNLYPKHEVIRTVESLYSPNSLKAVRLSEMFEP
ncbi:methylmalonyl-CoA mutase family protein [Chryseobacterium sp. A301]